MRKTKKHLSKKNKTKKRGEIGGDIIPLDI